MTGICWSPRWRPLMLDERAFTRADGQPSTCVTAAAAITCRSPTPCSPSNAPRLATVHLGLAALIESPFTNLPAHRHSCDNSRLSRLLRQ